MASNEQQTRVTIDRKEYQMLVTAAKKYKTTVQTLQQYHIEIDEKNKKIKQVEDAKIQSEVALAQAEQRIADLISIKEKENINKSSFSKTDEEGTHTVHFGSMQEKEKPLMRENPTRFSLQAKPIERSSKGELVPDCAPISVEYPSSLPPPYESTESPKILYTREEAATPHTGPTHDTVPREIFEKVTTENIRLRNQLDEEEQEKDMFRDASEYEDIIKQLKVDQVNLHGQVDRLQRILTAMKDGSHSALGTHLVELQSKVAKQDKVIENKATLLEMYGKEIDKLKNEIDSLKLQLFKATGSSPQTISSSEVTSPQDKISGLHQEVPKESYVSHLEKEIERVKLTASKDKNDLKTSLKKLVSDKVLLQQKCEEYAASVDSLMKSKVSKDMPTLLVQLQKENIELTKKLNVYRHELEKTITEKDIADTQAQLFKEDFEEERAEREKAAEASEKHKNKLLQDLAAKKGHISRLTNECAQLSKKWREETEQKKMIETKYEGLIHVLKSKGAIKTHKEPAKSCATTVGSAIKVHQPPSSLYVDSSMTPSVTTYTCERCLRDFTDEKKYKEHVQRCLSSV